MAMIRPRSFRPILLVPVLVLLFAPFASAGLIVQLESVTPDLSFPGDFRWSYSLTIPDGEGCISTGCFFTIYDFRGIVTVETGQYFSAGGQLVGVTPSGLTPTDDPLVSNVHFSHTALNEVGPTTVHHFDIISTLNTIAPGQFAGQDSDGYPGPESAHSFLRVLGTVGVPAAPSSVPEPSSLILVASGLAVLAAAAWKARRRPRYARGAA